MLPLRAYTILSLMNLSPTELGILGVLAVVVFGGALKLGSRKKSSPPTPPHTESDPNANFQQSNTDYDH